jgi:hypothetical protein
MGLKTSIEFSKLHTIYGVGFREFECYCTNPEKYSGKVPNKKLV